jgi:hypothetical protein
MPGTIPPLSIASEELPRIPTTRALRYFWTVPSERRRQKKSYSESAGKPDSFDSRWSGLFAEQTALDM